MGEGIGSWAPSLIIAISTVSAFVAGRVIAWLATRWPRSVRRVRIVTVLVAAAVAAYFYFSPASRYALLLPAAFAFGHLSYGHSRMVPRLFD